MKFSKKLETVRSLRKRPRLYIKILLSFTIPLGFLYIILVINYMRKIKYENLEENEEYDNAEAPLFELTNQMMFTGEKLIHIDLKGAPPKIEYLLQFIPFIGTQGATGILIEYEDMFPYYGELEDIKALNAYTSSDIAAIVDVAANNNLTIIPLIPTFSHLEFVLKLEKYKYLREVESNPQVFCHSQREFYSILKKMIDQILEAHGTSEYLHIGCDDTEVIGLCSNCRKLQREKKWRKDHIYFEHVKEIAEYIAMNYPAVKPIVWGNKFITDNQKIILSNRIPDLVDVMLRDCRPGRSLFPRTNEMFMLTKLFKSLWIASAFKGTPDSTQIVINIDNYVKNLRNWMEFMEEWKSFTIFKGIALMGQQRLHHFSALSELLPVGIPSLTLSLKFLKFHSRGPFDFDIIKESLNCSRIIPVNLYEIKNFKHMSSLKCGFPGFKIYQIIHMYYRVMINLESFLAKMKTPGFTFYNIVHYISHPEHVHEFNQTFYKRKLLELDDLKNETRLAMYEIYDEHTIVEWITTYIIPVQMRLEAAIAVMDANRDLKKVWPRRPFVHSEWRIKSFFNKICTKDEILGCAIFNLY